MRSLLFITHPEVAVDAAQPVTAWSLSEFGRARMQHFSTRLGAFDVHSLWSSAEQKAIEAAAILGAARQLTPRVHAALGENDRTATGYLPKQHFERAADAFFAEPERSMSGWERAVDAQHRICDAIAHVIEHSASEGDIAVVSHGAVGTLLLCHLQAIPISRAHDQPSQGHYFAFECASRRLLHGWRPLE